MYRKYYKIHGCLLIVGVLPMVASYLFDFSDVLYLGLPIHALLQILAGIFFLASMLYYFHIIRVLHKISDITRLQVLIAVISHTMTLISFYIFENHIAFCILFLGSILMRSLTGVVTLDRQMESLCKELDFRLFVIGKEQEL